MQDYFKNEHSGFFQCGEWSSLLGLGDSLDRGTDDDDEQHSEEEGEEHAQNDLFISGQHPVR